jgi:cytochrome c peroxidase
MLKLTPTFRFERMKPRERARRSTGRLGLLFGLAAAALLAACGGGKGGLPANPSQSLSAEASIGEKAFTDRSLSASGKLSCAGCHSADNAHAPNNSLAVQLGGFIFDQQGRRSSPSLDYLSGNAPFALDAEGAPSGGFFWDGRADSLQDQAAQPLLGSVEMANASIAEVVAKLARAPYAADFRRVFGDDIFSRPEAAFASLTLALARYQIEDASFHAFTSKYDEFLRGRAALTPQEARGLALFNDPAKGNCAACHPSSKTPDGRLPLFTDFSYDNLGIPRNAAIARNADPNYFDLGLCERSDLTARTDLCGAFKVPSLRNVAKRHVYFHNGRFNSLKDALSFYVLRDLAPERWYPTDADGRVKKFDDLPAAYLVNVNTTEAPYNRRPGDAPALSEAEIDDVIAFLTTLSDIDAP